MIASPSNPWKLGLFVVLTIVLATSALVWFGAARFDRRTFLAMTLIDESVQGLETGAPVKFRGVTIGRVRAIQFAPDRRLVEVVMDIYLDIIDKLGLTDPWEDEGVRPLAFVDEGVRVQLSRSGITGITFLELEVFPPEQRTPMPDYDFQPTMPLIPSVPSRLKSLEASLTEALDVLPRLLRNADGLVQRVDRRIGELDVEGLVAHVDTLVASAQARLDALPPDRLSTTLEDVAGTARAARAITEALGQPRRSLIGLVIAAEEAFEAFHRAVEAWDPGTTAASLRRAGDGVAEFAQAGTIAVGGLEDDLAALRETLAALRALAELLERDPGVLLRGR